MRGARGEALASNHSSDLLTMQQIARCVWRQNGRKVSVFIFHVEFEASILARQARDSIEFCLCPF